MVNQNGIGLLKKGDLYYEIYLEKYISMSIIIDRDNFNFVEKDLNMIRW